MIWYKNKEGYTDMTAAKAINNYSKGTRTTKEKACKIRSMGDEQLIEYVNNRCKKAKAEGYNEGRKKAVKTGVPNYDEAIKNLCMIKGVDERIAREVMVVLYGKNV